MSVERLITDIEYYAIGESNTDSDKKPEVHQSIAQHLKRTSVSEPSFLFRYMGRSMYITLERPRFHKEISFRRIENCLYYLKQIEAVGA